jgi:hypothetical protein
LHQFCINFVFNLNLRRYGEAVKKSEVDLDAMLSGGEISSQFCGVLHVTLLRGRSKAVQVDQMKHTSKPPGSIKTLEN